MPEDDKDLHKNGLAVQSNIQSEKNESISCEFGIPYPTLQSIMSGHKNILSIKASTSYIASNIACYITCYILAGAGCIELCRETAISKSLRSSSYRPRVTWDQSLEGWEAFGSTSCRSWTSAVWLRCSRSGSPISIAQNTCSPVRLANTGLCSPSSSATIQSVSSWGLWF